MKKKKSKKSIKEFLSDAWLDLKFKIIILGSLFIAFLLVIILVFNDIQSDREILDSKANKYETYIDQLLLSKYTVDELKDMDSDELKMAIDIVIDEESEKNINAPKLNDFILPVKSDDYVTNFELTREAKKTWTEEDIENFWIDLDSLEIKNLDEKNYDYLKARLEDIR